MSQEQINNLIRIYNTLLLVNTKGEDTMIMSDCLRALQNFINEAQESNTVKEEN